MSESSKLTYFQLTIMTITTMIGAGILTSPSILLQYGIYSTIGWVIASIMALILGTSFAIICLQCGGGDMVSIVQQNCGNMWGRACALMTWFSLTASTSGVILTLVRYSVSNSSSDLTQFIICVLLLCSVNFCHAWSSTLSSRIIQVLTIAKISVFSLVAVAGLMSFNAENFWKRPVIRNQTHHTHIIESNNISISDKDNYLHEQIADVIEEEELVDEITDNISQIAGYVPDDDNDGSLRDVLNVSVDSVSISDNDSTVTNYSSHSIDIDHATDTTAMSWSDIMLSVRYAMYAACFAFFSFIGLEATITLANEAKNPSFAIPASISTAIIVSSIIFILNYLASVNVLGLNLEGNQTPVRTAIEVSSAKLFDSYLYFIMPILHSFATLFISIANIFIHTMHAINLMFVKLFDINLLQLINCDISSIGYIQNNPHDVSLFLGAAVTTFAVAGCIGSVMALVLFLGKVLNRALTLQEVSGFRWQYSLISSMVSLFVCYLSIFQKYDLSFVLACSIMLMLFAYTLLAISGLRIVKTTWHKILCWTALSICCLLNFPCIKDVYLKLHADISSMNIKVKLHIDDESHEHHDTTNDTKSDVSDTNHKTAHVNPKREKPVHYCSHC